MKSNNKQSSSTEENPTENRRRSASVDEIRDLYSALQVLVPNSLPEENTHTSLDPEDSELQDQNLLQEDLSNAPSTFPSETKMNISIDSDHNNSDCSLGSQRCQSDLGAMSEKRSSVPLLSVTHFNLSRRGRSQSLDTEIGMGSSSSRHIIPLRQDSVLANNQNKRSNTPKCQEELYTIVKNFGEVDMSSDSSEISQKMSDVDCNRRRAQSMEAHRKKAISSTTKHDNQSQALCPNKSKQSIDHNKILTLKAENFHTSVENADKISEKDFENALSSSEYEIKRKRLSLGDVLERQRARLSDPRTPYRRRSIGGSLLLNAIANPSSDSPKRRGSLASALALLARKNELQEILKSYQEKKLNERVNDICKDVTDGAPKIKGANDAQREMDNLLRSIDEQQEDLSGSNHEKLIYTEEEVRRQSIGPEMYNLLEAIQDLLVSGQTTPANSTPSGSASSSRRTSLANELWPGTRKESLDELEAYFKSKLEDINEQGVTKTSLLKKPKSCKDVKTDLRMRERLPVNNNRRTSGPQAELSAPKTKPPEVHKSSSSGNLLKPSDALQRRSEDSQDSSRRRSRSAQDLQLPLQEHNVIHKSASSSPRLKGKPTIISRSTSSDSQIDRSLWKEDQVMFANQVNKRLQDWLERATTLSQQEAVQTDNDKLPKDNGFVLANTCSSDNESESKPKKSHSRFAMRKVLRKKIKRSKSIHDLTQQIEDEKRDKSPRFKRANRKVRRSKSLHSLEDKEESQPKQTKQKPKIFRSPQNLLRIGRQHLLRSKSIHSPKKPQLETKNSRTTESDESFDDCSCSIDINPKTSNFPKKNQYIEDPGMTKAITGPRRSSFPGKKEKELLDNKASAKRSTMFPGPLFYQPGSEVSEMNTTNDNSKQATEPAVDPKRTPERRRFLFGNAETKQAVFYTQVSMKHNAVSPMSQTSSSGVDEWYNRSSSQDGLDNTPSTSPDINDFRYRTTSVESEDSGCPI